MPAPKSSRSPSKSAGAKSPAAAKPKTAATKSKTAAAAKRKPAAKPKNDGIASVAEQFLNGIINPLDLVILTRDRIQEALDDAAERGRVTRSDANDLVAELVKRSRSQTDELLAEIERRLTSSRDQLESATRKARRTEPVDRIVRTADRARRTVKVGSSFPILGYDDLTARQVTARLAELKPAELRRVRDHERRHANRKSVLDAVEKALA
jgi:polyhydroxyalkanoate synthesis regulator phasin